MIIVKFTEKTLKAVTHDNMQFIDDEGKPHSIDFRVCRKNWVEHINARGESPTLSEAESHCVGTRNSLAHPIYIEFYSEPHVRFEFRTPLLRPKLKYRQYLSVKQQYEQVGWQTLDLT